MYRTITKKVPHLFFLHGNVAVGLSQSKKVSLGSPGNIQSKLLFPIKVKDYVNDSFIKAEWDAIKWYLKNAYILTIFGYSAPATDIEAISLLQEGWNNSEVRSSAQIEIIDLKEKEILSQAWEKFIHTHHYDTLDDFYKSFIARFPRRSCEAMWKQLEECEFLEDHYNFPKKLKYDKLKEWFKPLFAHETYNELLSTVAFCFIGFSICL